MSVLAGLDLAQQTCRHEPDRTTLDCLSCGLPWPCATAKTELSEQYRAFPSLLLLLLVDAYWRALETSHYMGETPPDLYGRIVMWHVRRRNA